MSKKSADNDKRGVNDAADQDQPWNKQFDDDRDDSGNLSRVATRKKHKGGSILTWVVWIALALIIIVPVAWQAIASNQQSTGGNYSANKITVNSSKKKASSQSASKKASKKAAKKAAASSKKAKAQAEASSKAASSSKAQAAANKTSSKPAASSSSKTAARSSSSRTTSGSYTVKSGDNLFRIAKNHGMTLDQLLSLNGLSRGSTISAGQTLKVK